MPILNLFERAALRRNALIRAWVLGGALLVFGLLHWLNRGAGFEGPVMPFAAAWVIGAALTFGFAYLATRKSVPTWVFPTEKAFDLVLVTVLSALSAGCDSPLTALYLLVVFSSQIDLSRAGGRWVQGGALLGCLAAETFSSGFSNADYKEWVLWAVLFLMVTLSSERVVAPFKRDADRYVKLQDLRLEAEQRLAEAGDLKGFPVFLIGRLVELFGFQHGALLKYDDPTRELVLQAAINIPVEGQALLLRQTVGPDAQGVGVFAALERRTTFLREPASNPRLPPILRKLFEEAGSDRLAAVPMLHGGALVGVALLSSVGGVTRVEEPEIAFLEFTAGLVGSYFHRWEEMTSTGPRR